MRASHLDRLSSVITYTNLFVYLITGETSYHNSTALLIGLAVISCCSSLPVSICSTSAASLPQFLSFNLAATYSPTPSPVQYHRPLRSLPSCSGWERVLPLSASPPKGLGYLITQQQTTVKTLYFFLPFQLDCSRRKKAFLPQKGGDPAAPSDTATLLRLHPSYRSHLRQLPPYGWVTDFGRY